MYQCPTCHQPWPGRSGLAYQAVFEVLRLAKQKLETTGDKILATATLVGVAEIVERNTTHDPAAKQLLAALVEFLRLLETPTVVPFTVIVIDDNGIELRREHCQTVPGNVPRVGETIWFENAQYPIAQIRHAMELNLGPTLFLRQSERR